MVTTQRETTDGRILADQVTISFLVRLAGKQYKDADLGREIFNILKSLSIDDPLERRAYIARLDLYAKSWDGGANS